MPIILASSSPRRRELLSRLGLTFSIDSADIDESTEKELPPVQIVETLALKKAQAVAHKYKEGLVIAADTIVVLDNAILGKPVNERDALDMLMSLQGRSHQVYSGIAVVDTAAGRTVTGSELTEVVFRAISLDEARRYIASGEPVDKAGSYAIQGRGAVFVKEIHGDYFNVVGLPIFKLDSILKTFGLQII